MHIRPGVRFVFALLTLLALLDRCASAGPKLVYEKKSSRAATIVASLQASGLPSLRGKWYAIGPFDNTDNRGFDFAYPPEQEIDLNRTYAGKDDERAAWKEFSTFSISRVNDLKLFRQSAYCCVYLYHEIEVKVETILPVSLGSDDTLTVWMNGQRLLAEDVHRAAAPDQSRAVLKLKPGKNQLLVKVCNLDGEWGFYIRPMFPPSLEAEFSARLERDFPDVFAAPARSLVMAEAKHYRLVTLPIPPEIVMEVGGLAFRPDGKLYSCTRRGEVWLISNPLAEDMSRIQYKLFATGLHEPLGLVVDGPHSVYVVQRPELTKLVDIDGDDVVDQYLTVCDRWGVSGDYHEFAYGPARDRDGNFYVTLNVGFGGGHQSKSPWRGWCVKITPKGELTPYAVGLRSPNGINFSPQGDLFYSDNQGEWVASNKLHHVQPGEFYGHPAGLRWVKQTRFAGKLADYVVSGMLYDGQAGKEGVHGMPAVTPPCIWFPYGRMGQSVSEPIWDTTGGKFGPFAGQCFVGDQAKSIVMRVYLEKINGRYQGACFPFKSGFECGVNRLVFASDGTLFAGMTARGWGSVGPKAYGIERLTYTGVLPFEIQTMKLTKHGFDLTFTKPLDPVTATRLANYSMQSYTYNYWETYGSPEMDTRAEKLQGVTLSADGRTVSLVATGFRKGRVYEMHLEGVKSTAGDAVLHPEAYYTLNELP